MGDPTVVLTGLREGDSGVRAVSFRGLLRRLLATSLTAGLGGFLAVASEIFLDAVSEAGLLQMFVSRREGRGSWELDSGVPSGFEWKSSEAMGSGRALVLAPRIGCERSSGSGWDAGGNASESSGSDGSLTADVSSTTGLRTFSSHSRNTLEACIS